MSKLDKLHFKATPVLPMTFNDSVSYYETLCQLTKKLNETIEQSNENTAKIKNIFDAQAMFVPIATEERIGGIYGTAPQAIDYEDFNLSPIFVDQEGNASSLYHTRRVATENKIGEIKVYSEPRDGYEGYVYLDENEKAKVKIELPIASSEEFGLTRFSEEPEGEGYVAPVYLRAYDDLPAIKYTIPFATSSVLGGIKSQEYNRTGAVCNVHVDENGLATVKVPNFTIGEDITIPVATSTTIGGIKSQEHAVPTGTEYPVHVGLTGYASVKVPSISYTLPQANATTLGGIKASAKTSAETVEVKIDASTGKLYVPTGGESYTLPAATTSALGGVKVSATDANKTKLPVSIDSNDIIHAELGAATTSAFGGFKLVTGYSEQGNTHYVNVDSQGKAYVKIPTSSVTLYSHVVQLDKELTNFGDITDTSYVTLMYQFYDGSSSEPTYYSHLPDNAIFIGGYYTSSGYGIPERYITSEYRAWGYHRALNETVTFAWIDTYNDTMGYDTITMDTGWSLTTYTEEV